MALTGAKPLKELAKNYQLHPNQIKNRNSILRRNTEELFEEKRRKK